MRIKIQQFLRQGYSHSWAVCGLAFAEAFIRMGHDVDLVPTDLDKEDRIPERLKKYVCSNPSSNYDMQFSYTAPHNFSKYLSFGNKNRFGMWCYEFIGVNNTSILPDDFKLSYRYCDKFISPSEFNKQIFLDSKFPKNQIEVIPHGINLNDFEDKIKYNLKTNKKYKIALVIGQPHKRKNVTGALEAFGKAFNKNDDVCLIIKIASNNTKGYKFEVNFKEIYSNFIKKYPNHAEVEIIDSYIENIVHLYNAIDSVFTMSHGEGFYLPGLEILGANKLNIVPNYGGQQDFLNNNNSLLIDGSLVRAPKEYMYWNAHVNATMFKPSVENAAEKLLKSYKEYDSLINQFLPFIIKTKNRLTWQSAAEQLINLCK